jgi:hypothetical protein
MICNSGRGASVSLLGLLQVTNPIPLFPSDRNGVIIQLPAITGPQPSVMGTMTFGIETESNNSFAPQL